MIIKLSVNVSKTRTCVTVAGGQWQVSHGIGRDVGKLSWTLRSSKIFLKKTVILSFVYRVIHKLQIEYFTS